MTIRNNYQRVVYLMAALVLVVLVSAIVSAIDESVKDLAMVQTHGATPNPEFLYKQYWNLVFLSPLLFVAINGLVLTLLILMIDVIDHIANRIYTFGMRQRARLQDWRAGRQARREQERQKAFEADMARLGYTNKTTMVFVFVPVPTRVFVGPMAANRDERDHDDVHASV